MDLIYYLPILLSFALVVTRIILISLNSERNKLLGIGSSVALMVMLSLILTAGLLRGFDSLPKLKIIVIIFLWIVFVYLISSIIAEFIYYNKSVKNNDK